MTTDSASRALHDHLGRHPRRGEPRDRTASTSTRRGATTSTPGGSKYKNPWKDLRDTDLRVRNWDDDRRDADQLADGVVGEVIFPNTVPPFYPGFVLFAGPPKPEEYEHRRAGIQAHNRWMVDFCEPQARAQRAGIGQIFLNDIDDAIEDATWIKEHGLRGGVLLPTDRARRQAGSARSTTPTTTRCGPRSRTSTSR